MEDLILSRKDGLERNILKIIEFVKQVEKEHGLNEEQITFKYTHGNCYNLVNYVIIDTLVRIFGNIKRITDFHMPGKDFPHYYLKVEKKNKNTFFDILGKKTFEEVQAFMQSDFWDEEPDNELLRDLFTTERFQIIYVLQECKEHIKAEELNI